MNLYGQAILYDKARGSEDDPEYVEVIIMDKYKIEGHNYSNRDVYLCRDKDGHSHKIFPYEVVKFLDPLDW